MTVNYVNRSYVMSPEDQGVSSVLQITGQPLGRLVAKER